MDSGYPKSVYRGDIYKAFFQDGEYFWVHCLVLKRYRELNKRIYDDPDETWHWCVDLKEFEHDTGHSIIHYLYTGNYQCLQASGRRKAVEANDHELAEGLKVCIAADSLLLVSLHTQAQLEIERVGDRLSLRDIFAVVENLKISLCQVPRFRNYLQQRMASAKFGAPGEDMRQVVIGLASVNTLSTLSLKAMVLKHRQEVFDDNKTRIATPNRHLEKPNVQEALHEAEESTVLQLLEKEIEKRKEGGKKLKGKERNFLTMLECAASVLRSAGQEKESEKTKGVLANESTIDENKKTVLGQTEPPEDSDDESKPVEAVSKSKSKGKGKGKIEAWLRLDSDSYHAHPLGLEDNRSDWTVSVTEMTPSSKGGSWDVLECGSEE
ncbi:hypothetical protein NW768_008691 [Fusarium equiseti]|uniref:BTB domain-containing protein n=1 Tax=Fusarium equiseti TaxID=61235 RepID=A0ABQ8R501_FUSEQ|nr:hypothetical protein NW768_008691 [Fusarium equiseti]